MIPRRRPPVAKATLTLLAFNIAVFLFQISLPHRDGPLLEKLFYLSLGGLKKGFVWQILTFQFLHGGIMHILFNSIAIFVFGRVVEFSLGKWEMLKIYFISGIVGGLTQMLGTLLLPSLFPDVPVLGASAGASGLIAAFAVLYPEQIIYMLLVVIPLKMRARSFLWLCLVLAVLGIFYPLWAIPVEPFVGRVDTYLGRITEALHLGGDTPMADLLDGFFGGVAHSAHLGGGLAGFIMARILMAGVVKTPPVRKPPVIQPMEGGYPATIVRD